MKLLTVQNIISREKKRNEEANKQFKLQQEVDDINGLFMRDIIRERIDNNDSRLR